MMARPKSPQVSQTLFGDWILDLKYYRLRETELDGIPLVVKVPWFPAQKEIQEVHRSRGLLSG